MTENTRICQTCCNPPLVAKDSSQYISNQQDLTQYIYVSTIQSQKSNYVYQYKSQTERIQALQGKLSNPQSIALRKNGGQC